MFEHNPFHQKSGPYRFLIDPSSPSAFQITGARQEGQRKTGQVVVEYILLLTVAVIIAGLIMRGCVSRDENQAGVVVQFWDQMLKIIGQDQPDEP